MERVRFEKGDIVYWCHQVGHHYSVHFGIVEEQFNRHLLYIDYLEPRETRLVNRTPIDEFENETRYKKLPKSWSYDTELFEITNEICSVEEKAIMQMSLKNPNNIKKAYEKGYLVERSKIFQGTVGAEINKNGYRLKRELYSPYKNPNSISKRPDEVYLDYDSAKKEVDANIYELERQSNLTDLEWSIEQIDKTLKRLTGKNKTKAADYRKWLLELDDVEDIETRFYKEDLQWKYWKNKKWRNIEL